MDLAAGIAEFLRCIDVALCRRKINQGSSVRGQLCQKISQADIAGNFANSRIQRAGQNQGYRGALTHAACNHAAARTDPARNQALEVSCF